MYDGLLRDLRDIEDYGGEDGYTAGQAADAIEALEHKVFILQGDREAMLRQIPRWTSVAELLPPEKIPVLVICKNGAMFVAKYWMTTYDGPHWDTAGPLGSGRRIAANRITCWMPLPESPKEER